MAPRTRIRLIMFASILMAGSSAYAQLPWQNAPQPAPGYAAPAPAPYYPAPVQQEQYRPAPAPHYAPPQATYSTREEDDRMLNKYATRFYNVTVRDPQIVAKLKVLYSEVRNFSRELESRPYDVHDIKRDADKLAWRINRQRKQLEEAAMNQPPAAAQAPAPVPHVVR